MRKSWKREEKKKQHEAARIATGLLGLLHLKDTVCTGYRLGTVSMMTNLQSVKPASCSSESRAEARARSHDRARARGLFLNFFLTILFIFSIFTFVVEVQYWYTVHVVHKRVSQSGRPSQPHTLSDLILNHSKPSGMSHATLICALH